MVLLPLTLINIDIVVLVGLINCIVMTVLIRCLPFFTTTVSASAFL